MITATPVDQYRIREVVVGDHRKQRLRQVEVDVRVHAKKQVLKSIQSLRRCEGQPPGPWRRFTGKIGIVGNEE